MHYNLLVIGSGSGGIATARRAAYHSKLANLGLKIAVVERDIPNLIGGTCVSRGCVPKKVMWTAANLTHMYSHIANHYGLPQMRDKSQLDYTRLVQAREVYTARLRGIYKKNLKEAGIDLIDGFAKFENVANKTVQVGESTISADYIVIATGGLSVFPKGIEGVEEHCIDSDGFFELKSLPKSAIVVGGGYIAVELAGVLQSLGTSTSICIRGESVLRNFDSMLSEELETQMTHNGVKIIKRFAPIRVTELDCMKTLTDSNGGSIQGEVVLFATGRSSRKYLSNMNVPPEMCSTNMDHIIVDEFQATTVDGIFAVGDVIGKAELTPVAIAAGRRLADKLFANVHQAKVSYDNIPTVVFSHPPIGTIGLTEAEARDKYKTEPIRIYTSGFVDSKYGILPVDGPPKPKTRMKLVCVGTTERIVGLHVIGDGADEMLQGFAVAIKMNATKADFDNCIAIHPTASEEFVTMAPWGLK